MKATWSRTCPKCGSNNIVNDLSFQAYAQGTFFNQFICQNCEHTGTFFPEVKRKE